MDSFSREKKSTIDLRAAEAPAPQKTPPVFTPFPIVVRKRKVSMQAYRPSSGKRPFQETAVRLARARFVRRTLVAGFGAACIALIAAGGMFGYGVWHFQEFAVEEGHAFAQDFSKGLAAMSELHFSEGRDHFISASGHLQRIKAADAKARALKSAALIGSIAPEKYRPLVLLPDVFDTIERASELSISIAGNLDRVKEEGIPGAAKGEGGALLAGLRELSGAMEEVRDILPGAQQQVAQLTGVFPALQPVYEQMRSHFVTADIWLSKSKIFLSALTRFLDAERPRHVLVVFQNPSELRASGGFIGSYADIEIRAGAIASIDVRDIYDPDGQLDIKTVPPKQLRGITTAWEARDANWFFDFPASMGKVMEFLERSKIYEERGIAFDGAFAINTFVIEDMLSVIGPIAMPEYDLVIDETNFLAEVQKEVEAGEDKWVRGEPKRILKLLAPRLLERLMALSDQDARKLYATFAQRAKNKDIMLYFRNPTLQAYVEDLDLGGRVFPTPASFRGNYLGVVNSNVSGGKTDIMMRQAVALEVDIEPSGVTHNRLKITRTHDGAGNKYSWYRAINQDFIRIYAPLGAALKRLDGFSKKRIYDRVDYVGAGYRDDPLIEQMEYTADYDEKYYADIYTEFDKRVFGAWMNTEAGDARTLEADYTLDATAAVGNGEIYEFVIDKQSGEQSSYRITFFAPDGYTWRESGNQIYEYTAPEIFTREIIKLTMQKR